MTYLLPVYARREPTTDRETAELNGICPGTFTGKRDVQIYRDAECTERFARYPWHWKRPDRRNRYVTLNCFRWRLVWLPDLPPIAA